jgi:hypothetical protein
MKHAPDLEAVIGASLPGSHRDRLRCVHDLLVQAGPVPELPASLRRPPPVSVRELRFGRERASWPRLVAAAAAALVLAAAASGAYVFTGGPAETVGGVFVLHATAAAPAARGRLTVGDRDRAGNWPLTLRVRGLPVLPAGGVYEMYLTDKGHLVGGCGVFRTDGGTTVIHLNVPYQLGEYSGWVISQVSPHQSLNPPLLTTS